VGFTQKVEGAKHSNKDWTSVSEADRGGGSKAMWAGRITEVFHGPARTKKKRGEPAGILEKGVAVEEIKVTSVGDLR